MNEELDDDLKRRISEVFDNFEDTTADEGWILLREKFPPAVNHRGTAWLWWASAAAMFLLVLGIGIWVNLDKPADKPQTYAQKPAGNKQPVTNVPASATPANGKDTPAPGNARTNLELAADNTDAVFTPQPTLARQPKKAIKPLLPVNTTDGVTNNGVTNVPPADDRTAITLAPAQQPADAIAVAPIAQPPVVTDGNKPTDQPVISPDVTRPVQASVMEKKPASQQAPANTSILAMLEQDDKAQAAKRQQKNKSDNDRLVNFGVYAATYVNYAKGSDNNVNVGAGLSSDFRISKNIKLSTGVSIAQNSFNYGGAQIPQVAAKASLVANSIQKEGFGPASSVPTVQNYNARLVGLDVPLNIKYEFNPEKNDTYISAGLSSGTFINENYTYNYNYNAPFSSTARQEVSEKINEQFNEFYFARTLNLAFGVGYPLGKHNRLVIEPFVKYPLSGLGVQQIKFGAGGINLKLNFQTGKR